LADGVFTWVKAIVRLAGAWVGLTSCRLRGPKSVRSGNGQLLIVLCHLVSLPVSTPLQL